MKILLSIISVVGLLLTIIPAFLVFFGSISLEQNKNLMLVGTILWFLTAPFWLNKKTEEV